MTKDQLSRVLLVLVLLCILLIPMGVLGAGPEPTQSPVEGRWELHVHWYRPEVIGTAYMHVDMVTPWLGTVSSDGQPGFLLTNEQRVLWTFHHGSLKDPWYALYFGTLSLPTASGRMINRQWNYGDWTATKVSFSQQFSGRPGVELGASEAGGQLP